MYFLALTVGCQLCQSVGPPIELEAPRTASYPRVREQALSPKQQAEHLSGPDTRAIQNYFRILSSVGIIQFRGSALLGSQDILPKVQFDR